MDFTSLAGKRFIASYSTGKDSTLALYKAIQAGMIPQALIITFKQDADTTWFHQVTSGLLDQIADSLDIPIVRILTTADTYEKDFEAELTRQRKAGAEVCVFGDIDLEGHRAWGEARCAQAGLTPYFPLWHMDRKQVVLEFVAAGFIAPITIIKTSKMDGTHLGKPLTKELIEQLEQEGVDPCGEGGEFHTLVIDGPLFSYAIDPGFSAPIVEDDYVILRTR